MTVRKPIMRGLKWPGGKSPLRLGRWVASLLPDPGAGRQTYIEPYAGMLGVLLSRPPTFLEMVNDSDQRVVNWWKVVRDHHDELKRLLRRQPYSSKVLHDEALHDAEHHRDPIRRALALTVVMTNTNAPGKAWRGSYVVRSPRIGEDVLDLLAERLRMVQLYCGDAVALLERAERVAQAVIFVDPPYPSTSRHTRPYAENDVDVPRLAATLRRQKGRVALSGYNTDPWTRLLPGWRREQKPTRAMLGGGSGGIRTACLWMNYGLDGQRL
ncbi:MAG: DNA adenine methylase [Holophagales bacterium]|nr:DNA adenine methylase [Holophagales bacterium]MYG29334.1 DNA adenine methylase [Holophagales bacterium]MYI81321.1 DNA adenine methylase [Holophagales bacterium]